LSSQEKRRERKKAGFPSVMASPSTRFNLKNILGANPSDMNSGRSVNVPASKREKCCFCFELRVGVITIVAIYLIMWLLSIANMIVGSLSWEIKLNSWKTYEIFWLVISIPFALVGLMGALKRKQKMVYVYFLFSILYAVVSLCASIAFLVQIGRGQYREYVNQYCTVNAPSFVDKEDCIQIAAGTLKFAGAFSLLFAFVQIYWTYVVRRLYLSILIQSAGNNFSYGQV
jgi:hypothetical protein